MVSERTSRAIRIYKTYGESAIFKIRENPYQLLIDISMALGLKQLIKSHKT
ncbi:MAG: helix-hairpin-helix domain-containing protein [Arsenophonus sp. NEOnobi-MAG3]